MAEKLKSPEQDREMASTSITSRDVKLGGFSISRHSTESLAQEVERRFSEKSGGAVVFVNSNFVVTCQNLRGGVAPDNGFILVNDGIGVDIGALLTGQSPFSENLNGTDFVPALLRRTTKLKVLMYGARPESVSKAAQQVQSWGHQVVGAFDGYGSTADEVLGCARASQPDLVLVALGNPRQEAWIVEHMPQLPNAMFMGVGALFDFLGNTIPRAPTWVRRFRFEWLYRLVREPRRLAKRYTIDFVRFLMLCIRN